MLTRISGASSQATDAAARHVLTVSGELKQQSARLEEEVRLFVEGLRVA